APVAAGRALPVLLGGRVVAELELDLERALLAVDVEPAADLEARQAVGDLVAEAVHVGGVEVHALVAEQPAAVDLERVVVVGQGLDEAFGVLARDEVLAVDAPLQGGAPPEGVEPDRRDLAEEPLQRRAGADAQCFIGAGVPGGCSRFSTAATPSTLAAALPSDVI